MESCAFPFHGYSTDHSYRLLHDFWASEENFTQWPMAPWHRFIVNLMICFKVQHYSATATCRLDMEHKGGGGSLSEISVFGLPVAARSMLRTRSPHLLCYCFCWGSGGGGGGRESCCSNSRCNLLASCLLGCWEDSSLSLMGLPPLPYSLSWCAWQMMLSEQIDLCVAVSCFPPPLFFNAVLVEKNALCVCVRVCRGGVTESSLPGWEFWHNKAMQRECTAAHQSCYLRQAVGIFQRERPIQASFLVFCLERESLSLSLWHPWLSALLLLDEARAPSK